MTWAERTIHEAVAALRRGEVSAVELTEAVLQTIQDRDPAVRAYLTVAADSALEAARTIDAARARGEPLGPLAGAPLAVKDNILTAGLRTTCASRLLENFIPVEDATVVRRLKAAGAIIIGKTNLDEFAMGSSCEYSAFFPTRNPWALDRVPGGSSGGSAAAVAADMALGALGSDTGGSVRLPASFCGIVGLKPTYGRVSRYGLVAFASSLDQIGPMTKDVTDCALLLNVIAGHDPLDATSLDWPVPDYTRALVPEVRGLRIGLPREYHGEGIEPGVRAAITRALQQLAAMGAIIEETSLPHTRYALDAYYIIAPAEASANLARYDGVRYGLSLRDGDVWTMVARTRGRGFGPEVKRRIMLGTYVLSAGYYEAYYLQAQKVRTLIKQDFDRAFASFDLLAAPTCPTVAFRLGERLADPLAMYLSDVFTVTVNIAGIPALVVPCGLADGLPVGLQLLGPPGGEERLLHVGYALEQALGRLRRPAG